MSKRKQNMSSTYFLENKGVLDINQNPNRYSRSRLRDIYRKPPTKQYRRGTPTIKGTE